MILQQAKIPTLAERNHSMTALQPHYLLFSESSETAEPGRWRFVLRASDGSERLVADDVEPDTWGERLELLTVVRGLEALDQPSRVTLMTPSAYVREGIRYGVPEWRRNGWRWECFGQMIPVKNGDLWQRVDRLLRFHEVECRIWRLDPPHHAEGGAPIAWHLKGGHAAGSTASQLMANRRPGRILGRCRRWLTDRLTRRHLARPTQRRPFRGPLGLGKLVLLARILGPHRPGLMEDPQENLLGMA